MDTNTAIKSLYQIVVQQQDVLTKLAQVATPLAPPAQKTVQYAGGKTQSNNTGVLKQFVNKTFQDLSFLLSYVQQHHNDRPDYVQAIKRAIAELNVLPED